MRPNGRAYRAQVAINGEYKHEVAVQHSMIVQMRASWPRRSAPATSPPLRRQPARVATTSYGWGTL